VYAAENAIVSLISTHFADNYGAGLLATAAAVRISNCSFRRHSGAGAKVSGTVIRMTDCNFTANGGAGLEVIEPVGLVAIVDGVFYDNGGPGLQVSAGVDSIVGCWALSNDAGGMVIAGAPLVDSCTIEHNAGSGVLVMPGASPTMTRCEITDNQAVRGDAHDGRGGGVLVMEGAAINLTDCSIRGNTADWYGGGVCCDGPSDVTVTRCVIHDNTSDSGGGLFLDAATAEIIASTIHGNRCPQGLGGGVWLGSTSTSAFDLEIRNTIITGNEGYAIYCDDLPLAEELLVSCTVITGNTLGNWSRCLSDRLGRDGNRAADPLFCDADGGDFRLQPASPCHPDSTGYCGAIGAQPVGCEPARLTRAAPAARSAR
jgi:hypothetical protein